MEHQNKSQNTAAEDNLIKSAASLTVSSAGMDPKEMAEENQKSKAESQQYKKANSNQFADEHSMMEMGSQIGEELEKMGKEMDGMNLQKEVGKLVEESSGLMAQDEDQEEGILVPNWVIEVLAWIERIEMADSALSYSSRTFQRLCWPKLHGNVEPHMVGAIKLKEECDNETGNMRAIAYYEGQLLPIPSTPPPEYIIGFKHINILFLDDSVLKFIKCIAPKLDDIKFVMKMKGALALRLLLNPLDGRIGYFHFGWDSNFKMFNSHFPNFTDQCLWISCSKFKKSEFDVLFEWLTNRRQVDAGKQKVLKFASYDGRDFLGRIKEEFSDSTKPLNFLIKIQLHFVLPEYDVVLENENTGEVFISYWSLEFHGRFIIRCPKGQEEQWKKEGEEKMKKFTSDDVPSITMDIRSFGTLSDLA